MKTIKLDPRNNAHRAEIFAKEILGWRKLNNNRNEWETDTGAIVKDPYWDMWSLEDLMPYLCTAGQWRLEYRKWKLNEGTEHEEEGDGFRFFMDGQRAQESIGSFAAAISQILLAKKGITIEE